MNYVSFTKNRIKVDLKRYLKSKHGKYMLEKFKNMDIRNIVQKLS